MNRSPFGAANVHERASLIVLDVDEPQIRIEPDFARHAFRKLVGRRILQVADEHPVGLCALLEEAWRGRSVKIVHAIAAVYTDEHGAGFVRTLAGDGDERACRLDTAA